MTGMVLEVTENSCLVMDRNGIIHELPVKEMVAVGEIIPIPQQNMKPMLFSVLTAAAIAIILVVPYMYSKMIYISPDIMLLLSSEPSDDSEIIIIEDKTLPLAASPNVLEKTWVFPVCAIGAIAMTTGIVSFYFLYKKKLKHEQ